MAKGIELTTLLKEKNREELAIIIAQLLEWQPELYDRLELLVKLPLAQTNSTRQSNAPATKKLTVDEAKIRRQVLALFNNAGNGWRAALRVAEELRELSKVAHKFVEADQWENARVIYTAIAEEAAAHYNDIEDETEVYSVIDECVSGLVSYLDTNFSSFSSGDPVLIKLFKTLYELWKFGEDYGSFEEKLNEIIIAYITTPGERGLLEEWIRADIAPGIDFTSRWKNQRQINFLVALKQSYDSGFGTAELLEEYSKAGLYGELAEKLVELNRQEEAVQVVLEQLEEPRKVMVFADKLLAADAKNSSQALGLVKSKLLALEKAALDKKKKRDYERDRNIDNYRAWLNEKLLKYGSPEQALSLALQRFQASPNSVTYLKVKETAKGSENWPELSKQLRDTLVRNNRQEDLVKIYLQEGEVEKAVDILLNFGSKESKPTWQSPYNYSLSMSDLFLETARAAEKSYPDKAVILYRQAAERLVELRGRDNYQVASKYIAKIRELYLAQQCESDWQQFIANFRKDHKSLAALKEELDKNGLN